MTLARIGDLTATQRPTAAASLVVFSLPVVGLLIGMFSHGVLGGVVGFAAGALAAFFGMAFLAARQVRQ